MSMEIVDVSLNARASLAERNRGLRAFSGGDIASLDHCRGPVRVLEASVFLHLGRRW